jgi:hypothetical protein
MSERRSWWPAPQGIVIHAAPHAPADRQAGAAPKEPIMATAARKTATTATAAKSAPETPAETAPAATPANGGLDLAALASGAQVAASLPKAQRTGSTSPLLPLLERSLAEKIALTLPTVKTEDDAKVLQNALRRAVTGMSNASRKVGVSIRVADVKEDGKVVGHQVTFQARLRTDGEPTA